MNFRQGLGESMNFEATRPSEPSDNSRAVAIPMARSQFASQMPYLGACMFVALVILLAMSTTVSAQVQVMKMHPAMKDPKVVDKMKKAAKAYARAPDANLRYARPYFSMYVPGMITQREGLKEMGPMLDDVRSKLKSAERFGKPWKDMSGWVFGGLLGVAKGNYHPAARINAILFISRMKQEIEKKGKPLIPISAIPASFLPIYQDAKNPDGVRAAALMALHRYVSIKRQFVSNNTRAALVPEMKKLLASEAPDGRDEVAHAYLQRFAVDILAFVRKQADPELGKTLVSISTETKKHDLIALHSAARIADLVPDLKDSVEADKVLTGWTIRAMRSFQYEIARLNALDRPTSASQPVDPASLIVDAEEQPEKKKTAAGMEEGMEGRGGDEYDEGEGMEGMMMEYGPGMGGTGFGTTTVPQKPEVFASRRKLNFVLQQLHLGVSGSGTFGVPQQPGGLLAATPDGDNAMIEEWLGKMQEVLTSLNDGSLMNRKAYMKMLSEQVDVLKEMAGAEAVAAAQELEINVPGQIGPARTEVDEIPTEPVRDKSGAPKFPDGLDELAIPAPGGE